MRSLLPTMELLAPAKINLCLYLGGRRLDGLHRLVSLFEPAGPVDRLRVERGGEPAPATGEPVGGGEGGAADRVVGMETEGENTVLRALRVLRAAGWRSPPVTVRIEKRIPVGAGLGGGSADAAAVLRWATKGAGRSDELDPAELGALVGADVPSQIEPAFTLVGGAGEELEALPEPVPHAVLLLTDGGGLSTAAVFAEADRLGLGRDESELDRRTAELREATAAGNSPLEYTELLTNDLEAAAFALRPDLADSIEELRLAGAAHAAMTGSGSTVFGLFADLDSAERAAARLDRPGTLACRAGADPSVPKPGAAA